MLNPTAQNHALLHFWAIEISNWYFNADLHNMLLGCTICSESNVGFLMKNICDRQTDVNLASTFSFASIFTCSACQVVTRPHTAQSSLSLGSLIGYLKWTMIIMSRRRTRKQTVMFANAHLKRIYLHLYCDCIIAKADVAILLIAPRVLTASFGAWRKRRQRREFMACLRNTCPWPVSVNGRGDTCWRRIGSESSQQLKMDDTETSEM